MWLAVERTAHFLTHGGDKMGTDKWRRVDFREVVKFQSVVLLDCVRKTVVERTKAQTVKGFEGDGIPSPRLEL